MDLVLYAVPIFVGSMLLEACISLRKRNVVFKWNDTLCNLTCGMGSQLAELYTGVVVLGTYAFVYDRWRLFRFADNSWVAWLIALIGVDLIYYTWHRLSHVSNVLWASHVVHHQSEEYNLAVALRQSWFGGLTAWLFYLPLALLGIPPLIYAASYSINLLYQFFVHTKAVKSLGPLEWILNTPSHHRVHHGSNRLYLDRNFAGILIIWDRLFGTFQREEEEVRYGLVKPLRSWNPVWANLAGWWDLVEGSRRLPRWRDKLLLWIKNPGWQPGDTTIEDAADRVGDVPYVKYETQTSRRVVFYLSFQFVGMLVSTVLVMAFGTSLPSLLVAWIYASAISGMMMWEPLMRGMPWAGRLENGRNVLVLLGALGVAATVDLQLWVLAATGCYLVAAVLLGALLILRPASLVEEVNTRCL